MRIKTVIQFDRSRVRVSFLVRGEKFWVSHFIDMFAESLQNIFFVTEIKETNFSHEFLLKL